MFAPVMLHVTRDVTTVTNCYILECMYKILHSRIIAVWLFALGYVTFNWYALWTLECPHLCFICISLSTEQCGIVSTWCIIMIIMKTWEKQAGVKGTRVPLEYKSALHCLTQSKCELQCCVSRWLPPSPHKATQGGLISPGTFIPTHTGIRENEKRSMNLLFIVCISLF